MLETVREYSTELLATVGRGARLRDRHLEWFLHRSKARAVLAREHDAAWLERIELEHDNYRAALTCAHDGDVERELRLANALRYFWRVRGYVVEGRRRLEAAVELLGPGRPGLRARTLGEAGMMAFTGGDYKRSRELWTEALPLIEAFGEPREIARANFELGAWARARGTCRGTVALYEAASRGSSDATTPRDTRPMLANLAVVVPGDSVSPEGPRGIRSRRSSCRSGAATRRRSRSRTLNMA